MSYACNPTGWGREVMLKGGGPRMIVVDLLPSGRQVVCAWLTRTGHITEAAFVAAALVPWRRRLTH